MGKTLHLGTVDSTNTYALEHYDVLEDGMFVTADVQTGGRGRLGRNWLSPEGNLYGSFVMKDLFGEIFSATMVSSLAVLSAVREFYPDLPAFIKWPNDVFLGTRKLCGILCEGVVRNGKLSGMICGIGINVNMTKKQLASIDQPAVSLLAETGTKTDLDALRNRLSVYLNWYYVVGSNHPEELFSLWKGANSVTGREVTLIPASGEPEKAVVRDIRSDGKLVVAFRDGTEGLFDCGDVKIDI